ncbi:MAG: M14 family metallopeptidase [Crocinitomicaceae bacterium]
MKHLLFAGFILITLSLNAQWDGNATPTYPELIEIYQKLDAEHDEIELYQMGESDYGLPIYVVLLNAEQDSLKSFEAARNGTTLLINNAIHPGEPDGINACLIWIQNWIDAGKPNDLPIVAIIPAYNIGGMMNRSSTSRANQDGPDEYGFRGNAQNLDLNRDFIKMDSKNMFTFARIYHALDPDVFIDTHVSNGADYQYTMTYIASVRERMAPSLATLMHDEMIPRLKEMSSAKGFDLTPYVHTRNAVPDNGIEVFNDLPRYAMGYASLFNAISFTTETHMLKPFPQRVQSTLVFLSSTIEWMQGNKEVIELHRREAKEWDLGLNQYHYNYTLQNDSIPLLFKGFEHSYPKSEVTGEPRLKYHRDKPWEKEVPYFNHYAAQDSIEIPPYFFVEGQCVEVIERLAANNVKMIVADSEERIYASRFRIHSFKSGSQPYEGHFLHSEIDAKAEGMYFDVKPGDYLIPMNQENRRFILSVLVPDAPDSYFAWNYFDSYVQQKEYFSPYVFEDVAAEMLKNDTHLKKEFGIKKETDPEFAKSTWMQLYFLYKRSPYYEPTHNLLPIGMINPVERGN